MPNEPELLSRCESALRAWIKTQRFSFPPHIITTALETVFEEREAAERDSGLQLTRNRKQSDRLARGAPASRTPKVGGFLVGV